MGNKNNNEDTKKLKNMGINGGPGRARTFDLPIMSHSLEIVISQTHSIKQQHSVI